MEHSVVVPIIVHVQKLGRGYEDMRGRGGNVNKWQRVTLGEWDVIG
jgi:hypothetical protein